jgi:hypothetical protein
MKVKDLILLLQAYDPKNVVVIPNGTPSHDFLYQPSYAFRLNVMKFEDENRYDLQLFDKEANDTPVVVIA